MTLRIRSCVLNLIFAIWLSSLSVLSFQTSHLTSLTQNFKKANTLQAQATYSSYVKNDFKSDVLRHLDEVTAPKQHSLINIRGESRINHTQLQLSQQTSFLTTKSITRSKSKLLSREEEIELSQIIQAMVKYEQARDEMAHQMGRIPSEREWAAHVGASESELRSLKVDADYAKQRFVSANIGLVTSIASGHQHLGVSKVDLVQEGSMGLFTAITRFDADKNCRFSTYASWWIRQRILQSIVQSSRIIRVPANVHAVLVKTKRMTKKLSRELGRPPTYEELAETVGVPAAKVAQYDMVDRDVASIYGQALSSSPRSTTGGRLSVSNFNGAGAGGASAAGRVGGGAATGSGSLALIHRLQANDQPCPNQALDENLLQGHIHHLLHSQLDDRERYVIVRRYGLDGDPVGTVEEVAEGLGGIAADRVRVVEARALGKLRQTTAVDHRLRHFIV